MKLQAKQRGLLEKEVIPQSNVVDTSQGQLVLPSKGVEGEKGNLEI
ncbi:hypothetical protein Gotur_017793 [Gossypium turneri]